MISSKTADSAQIQSRTNLLVSLFALSFNIITWLTIYLMIKPGSAIIPLRYNVFYGTDLAEKGYYIYLIPASGLVIFLIDQLAYLFLRKKEQFAGQILNAANLVSQIVILIAVLFLKRVIII